LSKLQKIGSDESRVAKCGLVTSPLESRMKTVECKHEAGEMWRAGGFYMVHTVQPLAHTNTARIGPEFINSTGYSIVYEIT
jgi:hypothetical protein